MGFSFRDIAGPVLQVAGAVSGQPWLSAAGTAIGAYNQNVASARAAQEQMDFQRSMSNTAYQRQVIDLQRAGINPMLVTKLGGASTPVGALPSFVNPGLQAAQAYQASGAGEHSAAQAEKTQVETDILSETGLAQARANLEKTLVDIGYTSAQIAKVEEEIDLIAAQIATEKERPAQVRAMIDNIVAQTKTEAFKQLHYDAQVAFLKAQIPLMLAKTQLTENQVKAELNTFNMRRHVEQVLPAAGAAAAAVGTLFLGKLRGAANAARFILRR